MQMNHMLWPKPLIAALLFWIALISNDGTNYPGSDPLTGQFNATLTELKSDYQFTGFFLVFK